MGGSLRGFRADLSSQWRQDGGGDDESGHVPPQMAELTRVSNGVDRHHGRMGQTGPHGEPDQAEVSSLVAGGEEEEYPQRHVILKIICR